VFGSKTTLSVRHKGVGREEGEDHFPPSGDCSAYSFAATLKLGFVDGLVPASAKQRTGDSAVLSPL
jgi:hypothetical protein